MNDAKNKGVTKITLNDSVETYKHRIFLSNNTIFAVVYECYALLNVSCYQFRIWQNPDDN